ncbi:hypothetical protein ACFV16_22280 [Streptomyces massasporeus]|uniref:hypothetical protein n=1 Tax=Streptomyces massasporeus TaxID=67324 RepID=UPI0036CC1228
MSAKVKIYKRTENGVTTDLTVKQAMPEINSAMMEGKHKVREMSSSSRRTVIRYKDGRTVTFVPTLVDAPAETDERPDAWTLAGPGTLLHNFTQADKDGRALCNKSYRPHRFGNGYAFKTKAEQQSSEYAHLYTFCPRCEAK